MSRGYWAFIRPVERPSYDWQGRPVDPGYGVEEGVYPGQGLPGGYPGRPDQGFNPAYPDQGLPGGYPGRPDQGLPGRPPRPANRPPGSFPGYPSTGPVRPGRPVDPSWGIPDAPEIWPGTPDQPIHLPPVAGLPLPPVDPPPGTIWPPIDPGFGVPEGTALALVWISGVGYRYAVLTIPPPSPETLPG